jgi:uncharacterized protein
MSILTYHDPAHTLNFFLPVALALADLYGIKESDPVLYQAIELAAKSHDIGFMYQYENNEPIAAHVLEESLPRFEFKRPLIGLNSRLILVTSSSLSEDPKDLLEMLMCDSDLGILGHSDFPDRNAALRQELANYGQEFTDEQWYTSQLGFLRNHRYFTTAAQSMFDEQKEKNVEYMQSKLDELNRMWSK